MHILEHHNTKHTPLHWHSTSVRSAASSPTPYNRRIVLVLAHSDICCEVSRTNTYASSVLCIDQVSAQAAVYCFNFFPALARMGHVNCMGSDHRLPVCTYIQACKLVRQLVDVQVVSSATHREANYRMTLVTCASEPSMSLRRLP